MIVNDEAISDQVKKILEDLKNSQITTLDFSKFDIKNASSPKVSESLSVISPVTRGGLAVLLDGRIASGHLNGSIMIWDLNSKEQPIVLKEHTKCIFDLAVLKNGLLASASNDKTVRLWRILTRTSKVLQHKTGVVALAPLSDGRLATGGGDGDFTIKIWNVVGKPNCELELSGHTGCIVGLTELQDGRLASSSQDNTIKCWNLNTHHCEATLTGHTAYLRKIFVLPNGWLASGACDKTVRLWDVTTYPHVCKKILEGHNWHVSSSFVMVPGGYLASAANTIKFWDINTGKCVHTLTIDDSPVFALCKMPDGRLVGGNNSKIHVWTFSSLLNSFEWTEITNALKKNNNIINIIWGDLWVDPEIRQQIEYYVDQNKQHQKPFSPELDPNVKWDDLKIETTLGEGAYGIVYKALWKNKTVAVKEFKGFLHIPKNEFDKESKIITQLNSPYIVKIFGVCNGPNHYAFVMEYANRGSLWDILRKPQPTNWGEIRKKISYHIILGLSYLHEKCVAHRDLKSLNVLIGEDYQAVLTDFGLAKIKTLSTSFTAGPIGTYPWMAPELFNNQQYSFSSDIYSLGILLWEIMTRSVPFEGLNLAALIKCVLEGERPKFPKNPDCPPKYVELIKQCWDKRAENRPTAIQVVNYVASNNLTPSSN